MKSTLSKARNLLIAELKAQGITNPRVLDSLAITPREIFVEENFQQYAYENVALPIKCEQTVSQPYVVARMTSLLLKSQRPIKRVLEIGTGSGYQAAVLASLIEEVYSVERIKFLYETAKQRLQKLNITNVHLLYADGLQGWPEQAPFDGMLITAYVKNIPHILVEQLAIGGRLILPLEEEGRQMLAAIDHKEQGLICSYYDPVRFVPALQGVLV